MLQATMDLWALPFGITCCNEAVRNNPRKFPEGYVYELTKEESATSKVEIFDHRSISSDLRAS